MSFKQAEHNLLMILEVADSVLFANASPSISHTSPAFAAAFGDCIKMLREVLFTKDGQPFLIAGSGSLGWDMVAANLVEPGEDVLVLNSGYFGDSFADCLEVYGAKVDQLKAPVGDRPTMQELEAALGKKKYKVVTFTHVDTSTGVLSDAKSIGEVIKKASPESLLILDGVCSVASEEIRFDDWGIDGNTQTYQRLSSKVISATQKGLGCPPGLSVTCVSQKALKVLENRKTPVTSYYASWKRWLPIMTAYEKGAAAYFATPAVHLVLALQVSLKLITKQSPSVEERFAKHKEASNKLKDAVQELGLKQVPASREASANGMTAIYAPDGIKASDIVGKLSARKITVAAGLHKDIKEKYFRVGTMGVSVVDRDDVGSVIAALKEALGELGHKK